jgi:small subunit ribosomal protein S16
MAVKIRLQRHGKKGNAFFHIVVADGRAPRDGKFIEKLGTYNPLTNPATIDLNFDKTVSWLQNGAQPTDTARAILSYKGILYKYHLAVGVRKGAITQEQANAKFEKWLEEKTNKIDSKKTKVASVKQNAYKQKMEAETAAKEARAAKIAAKLAAPAPAAEAEAAPEAQNEQPAEG